MGSTFQNTATVILNWTYKSVTTFAEGPLSYLFQMAYRFIELIIPSAAVEYIFAEVPRIFTGDFAFNNDNIMELILHIGGLAACLIIAILFIIVSLLTGPIFACCRSSGKCGGHSHHRFSSGSSLKQKLWEFFLFVFMAITSAGILCAALASSHGRMGILQIGPTLTDAIDDIFLFLNNTIDGMVNTTDILVDEFNSTKTSVISDLNDIGTSVTATIVQLLRDEGGLQDIFNALDSLQINTVNLHARLTLVDGNLTELVNTTDVLKDEVVETESRFQDAIIACVTSNCTSVLNAIQPAIDAFGDAIGNLNSSDFRPAVLNSTIEELDQVLLTNFSSLITEEFNTTAQLINDMIGEPIEAIVDILDSVNVSNEITPVLLLLNDQLYLVQNTEMLSFFYSFINVELSSPVIGNIVMITLLCIVAAPALTLLSLCGGLLCGFFGTCKEAHPSQRGGCSRMGAKFLMAGIAKIFIFSWFLMLVTTLLFILSAPVSRLFCLDGLGTITQLERIAAEEEWFSIQSMLPEDVNISITVTDVMRKCDEDQSILDALSLKEFIEYFIDYFTESMNIEGEVANFSSQLNLSEFVQVSSSIDMSGVSTAFQQFDANLVVSQLDSVDSVFNSSDGGVTDLADQLETISVQLSSSDAAASSKLNETVDLLRGPVYNAMVDINTTKSVVLGILVQLGQDIIQISGSINDTEDGAVVLQQYIDNNSTTIILTATLAVLDTLMARLDTFIGNVITKSGPHLRCKPLMDVYHSLVDKLLCGYLVNSLNAFWFCLGEVVFCFFFIVIIAACLSKYYRRMKWVESDDDDISSVGSGRRDMKDGRKPHRTIMKSQQKTQHFKNQVYP